jgi:CubicO group peptidase (beta-lactamase class C family)
LLSVVFAAALAISHPDDRLPLKDPAAVGMSAARLEAIDKIIGRGISEGAFPGAAVVVGRDGYAVVRKGYGRLTWSRSSAPISAEESIYDLASLTKVIATTTAAMILYDEGRLQLDAPVQRYLPEFTGRNKEKVTVAHLLTHHSGLPAGRLLYNVARSASDARRMVLASPLQCAPGSCFLYSDVGADILGWVVERIANESLDSFVARRVFGPLGMSSTVFRPAPSFMNRIAPTLDYSKRGFVRGEVHDESAFTLGGVAGHAGLFSTASDIAVFAQMLLNGGVLSGTRIVSDSTIRLFTKEVAHARALGWEVANNVHGAGTMLSSKAYGHTGFTGTSLWIDPEQRMFVVLLANRTFGPKAKHPADAISDVRNDLADVVSLAIDDGDTDQISRVIFRSDTARTWNRAARPAWRTVAEKKAKANASLPPSKRAPPPFPLKSTPAPAGPSNPQATARRGTADRDR